MHKQTDKMPSALDLRLIQALRENARSSTTALARELEVSRATVQNRLRKLEADGTIRGYTVLLGENYRRGLIAAHVLVEVEQRLTAQLSRALQAIPQISALYAISGDFDLIVVLEAQGTEALSQLLDQISSLDGVIRTKSSVILETKLQR